MNSRRRSPGFSLPEALLALVLLSSSLATTAIMLVQAVRHEREAACRSAAVRLAGSLAEQLRLMRRGDGQPLQAIAGADAPSSCATDADCAIESEVADVLTAWRSEAAASLPEGSNAQVVVQADAPPAYLIQIDWPDLGAQEGSVLRLAVEP